MMRLLAAAMIGGFCVSVAGLLIRPDKAMAVRLRPYLLHSRSQLGRPVDIVGALAGSGRSGGSVFEFLFAPFRATAMVVLERVVDVVDDTDELSLRMRQAGYGESDPARYRRRQLVVAAVGSVVFGVGMWFVGPAAGSTAVLRSVIGVVAGFWIGGAGYRAYLRSRAGERANKLKIEAYSVALLLTMVFKTGHGPVAALRQVAARTDGEITKDFDRAQMWLTRGTSAREVFDRLAQESPDHTVSRIFRLLATSIDSGFNPAEGMQDLAGELRQVRREELSQRATKRRSLMLIPILCVMLPVVGLYVLAPLSSILDGL